MDYQPFSLNDVEDYEQPIKKEELSESKKKLLIIGVATLFIILIIIIIILTIRTNTKSNDEDKNKEEQSDNEIDENKVIGEIDCIYDIRGSLNIKILSDEFNKNTRFDIVIDKKIIKFSREYKFNETGQHTVKFKLYEDVNMDYMFKGIEELISVIMISIKNPKIKSMISSFESCVNLASFTVNGFDFKEVKSMKKVFSGTKISIFNIKDFNTNSIEDMSYMFANSDISKIVLSQLNTTNVKNMSYMFYECYSLIDVDISKINTKNVIDMSNMFN